MELECPLCKNKLPVAQGSANAAITRLVCPHCDGPLLLDAFSGQLLAENKPPASRKTPLKKQLRTVSRESVIFHPRLSTGKDTLAAAFVIVCVVAILTAGVTLVLGKHPTSMALPEFNLTQVFDKLEQLIAGVMAGRLGPDSGKNRHLQRGKQLVQQASYQKGLRELDKAIEDNPASYEAHFWRGRALVKSGNEDEAIRAFETVLRLNPQHSYACDNLGWIYLRRNAYETSLDYLNRSLSLRPGNGWAYYNRGRIHFQLGQTDKAFRDAEEACRLQFKRACELLKRHGREIQS